MSCMKNSRPFYYTTPKLGLEITSISSSSIKCPCSTNCYNHILASTRHGSSPSSTLNSLPSLLTHTPFQAFHSCPSSMTRVPSSNSRKADTVLHFSNGAEEGAEEGELSEYGEGGLVPMSSLMEESREGQHYSVVAVIMTALRKSLVTCSLGAEEVCSSSMEIGRPTAVRHVSHVTFDRFHGFLGLPVEFQPQIPRRAPSASVRVFGVSPNSMQCSYDNRGNSVPTILLLLQRNLYSQGGLQAEGIFRINAENSQEEYVREQLNRGIMLQGIDVHCLAGLIKAWFRELPRGILDSLSPEQVMRCTTEVECSELVKTLSATEAALLDWAINLMADVAHYEHVNKMNAHNIAVVFAPNMTQMADPLTALIHVVRVMNFLKTLINQTLKEREEFAMTSTEISSSSSSSGDTDVSSSKMKQGGQRLILAKLLSLNDRSDSDLDGSFRSFISNSEDGEELEHCWEGEAQKCEMGNVENGRSSSGQGVRKLCRHPASRPNKSVKKSAGHIGVVNYDENVDKAWV